MTIILLVMADFAGYMLEAPQTDIFEGIICDKYYSDSNQTIAIGIEAERDCTIDPIQGELALVNELLRTFNQVPGIFLAVPYGILADSWGRLPVLILSFVGVNLQDIVAKVICWWPSVFPLRLVWLSPIGRIIGGGDAVASSMIYLIVADVFEPHERADCFFKISAAVLLGEIIASPLSAGLMGISSWLPYSIGLVFGILCTFIPWFFLPETKPTISSPEQVDIEEDEVVVLPETQKKTLLSRFRTLLGGLAGAKTKDILSRNVVLMLFAFFVASLGRQSTGFQLQFARKRFGWSFKKASLLIALRGVINLALLVVLLPFLNNSLDRRRWPIDIRDLFTARLSAFVLVIGSILVALAPHPVILAAGVSMIALGSGFSPIARSLATTMVDPTRLGVLYTALAVMASAGAVIAGPLLAFTFKWGMSLGWLWSGLPFMFVAMLFGLGLFMLSLVRLDTKVVPNGTDDEETESSLG